MTLRPAHLAHLVRRFFASFRPGGITDADRAWVASTLTPNEFELYERMSRQDQRHSLEVARRAEFALVDLVTDEFTDQDRAMVLSAALLHDVGKSASGLGTYARVIATLSGMVGGRSMAQAWQQRRGITRRVGMYLRHGEIGADLLRLAGSDPRVVAWSREHHLPAQEWTMPRPLGELLVAVDR